MSHNAQSKILLQVQESGVQARISISIEDAEFIIELLQENIKKAKSSGLNNF